VRDYNDLAKKMNNLLALDSKDFERMGLQSRKKMELEFDEKIVIAKYINLVNNTVHH
jgi:glycosyltransferase involved in cell wall biosynthesis